MLEHTTINKLHVMCNVSALPDHSLFFFGGNQSSNSRIFCAKQIFFDILTISGTLDILILKLFNTRKNSVGDYICE